MYQPREDRYQTMRYNRCGKSGVLLPEISLGLWHNFGESNTYTSCKEMVCGAFDLGITHFDIANNYGRLRARQRKSLAGSCTKN